VILKGAMRKIYPANINTCLYQLYESFFEELAGPMVATIFVLLNGIIFCVKKLNFVLT